MSDNLKEARNKVLDFMYRMEEARLKTAEGYNDNQEYVKRE